MRKPQRKSSSKSERTERRAVARALNSPVTFGSVAPSLGGGFTLPARLAYEVMLAMPGVPLDLVGPTPSHQNQWPHRYLPTMSEHVGDRETSGLEEALVRALDAYWDGPTGVLRLLNLMRAEILARPVPHPAGLAWEQADVDDAPIPSHFAALAGRALSLALAREEDDHALRWLRQLTRWHAPITLTAKPQRDLPQSEGFSEVHARVALGCLARASATDTKSAQIYATAGVALAAHLDNGSDVMRKASVHAYVPHVLAAWACGSPTLSRPIREAARLVAEGVASTGRVTVHELLSRNLEREARVAPLRRRGRKVSDKSHHRKVEMCLVARNGAWLALSAVASATGLSVAQVLKAQDKYLPNVELDAEDPCRLRIRPRA